MKQLLVIIGFAIFLLGCEKNSPIDSSEPDKPFEPNEKRVNLIKIITYSSFDKTNVHGMTTFDYDNENNLVKETYFYTDTIYPLLYSIYEYENNKKKVELLYNAAGAAGYRLSHKNTYFYERGKLVREERTSPSMDGVYYYIEYKYDERENLILESKAQVDPYFCWKTEYIYDSNNFKIKTIYFDEFSNNYGYTEHYYFDGLLSNEKNYGLPQNILYSEYDYTYNSEDKLIEKTETKYGETKILESISYSDSFISEKIIYDWSSTWGYRLMGVSVYVHKVLKI